MNLFNKIYSFIRMPELFGDELKTIIPKELEKEYDEDYFQKSIITVRVGLVLCVFLYAIFGLLDKWLLPHSKSINWFIRFAIVEPFIIVTLISSFFPFFKKYRNIIMSVLTVVAGEGIIAMIAFANQSDMGYNLYYAGLLLVILYTHTLSKLNFRTAILLTLITILSYEFVAMFFQKINVDTFPVFINNNFFLIATAILSMFSSYSNENLIKANFIQRNTIKEQSELLILRTQVNPHFLFNTINTLIGLIEENKDKAVDFAMHFSDTYRYMLQSRNKELYQLKEEITFIKSFSVLLLKRFENKLNIKVNIPEKYMEHYMPPLCLQLLIENATKHNEISTRNPLTIDIFIDEDEMLTVKNNIQLKIISEKSTKVGLVNIKERYKYLTHKKEVKIISDGKEYIVKLPLLQPK